MKNFFKLFGIIALTAVIGFSMAACKDDDGKDDKKPSKDSPLVGYWYKDVNDFDETLIFRGSGTVSGFGGSSFTSANYSVSGDVITISPDTTVYGDNVQGTMKFTISADGKTLTIGDCTGDAKIVAMKDFVLVKK